MLGIITHDTLILYIRERIGNNSINFVLDLLVMKCTYIGMELSIGDYHEILEYETFTERVLEDVFDQLLQKSIDCSGGSVII